MTHIFFAFKFLSHIPYVGLKELECKLNDCLKVLQSMIKLFPQKLHSETDYFTDKLFSGLLTRFIIFLK